MRFRDYIYSIRHEYSGLRDLPRESLASSVKTLADDLYAKDSHFIFELIQNAEDNEYRLDSPPKLRFEVRQQEIEGQCGEVLIVYNSEIGFLEKHVRAICQVGKSTKDKAQGYIGEKGIGFKSVFRITSCPYVFSNGFQFCLPEDDKETGLGYIVPRWVSDPPKGIVQDETTIILPINKRSIDVQTVVGALRNIAPETILFLKKLLKIEISVCLPGVNSEYEVIIEKHVRKVNGASKLVELTCKRFDMGSKNETTESFSYWLTEIEYNKPEDVRHDKRQGIESRTVSIAIPLGQSTKKGKLFAYLPVWEETGIPFLINADFLLVSSREAVREDEGWNKWLRNCVVDTYCKALLTLLETKEVPLEAIVSGYASIPIESHIPFLSHIIEPIHNRLQSLDCVLSLPNKSLLQPSSSRLCNNNFRTILGDPDNFPSYFVDRIHLVCPEIEPFQKELKAIGVKQVLSSDVICCLNDFVWISKHPITWFIDLFRYLISQKYKPEELQSLSIIPVTSTNPNNRLTFYKKQPIYFSLDESDQMALADVPLWLSKLVPIAILDSDLLSVIEQQKDSAQLRQWLTDTLRIDDFSIQNFCVNILAKLTIAKLTTDFDKIDNSQLLEATAFLAEYSGPDFDWEELPIVLTSGQKLLLQDARKRDVVVPEDYDQEAGWQHIWQQEEDRSHFCALSNMYSRMPKKWYESLKISFYPSFKEIKYPSWKIPDELVAEKSLASSCNRKAASSRSSDTQLTTYLPPSTLTRPIPYESLCKSLLAYLKHSNIPSSTSSSYKKELHNIGLYASGIYHNHGCYIEYAPSTVLIKLRNLPWFSTTKGVFRPAQAFLPKESIKEIFGDTVPYFEDTLPENVLQLLEVHLEVTVKDLLALLKDSSSNPGTNPDMAERVYSELFARTSREPQNILTKFSMESLILAKNGQGSSKWITSGECVWEDANNVLGDDFVYLQVQYPKLKDFFVDRLGVKERVDTECFARKWLKLQDSPIENRAQQRTLVERLYREIGPISSLPADERPDWWDDFVQEAKLYTQSDTFADPCYVVIPDDGELRSIFQGTDDLEFVWRPEKDAFNDWLPFYKAFNVPLLSESVTEQLEDDVDFEPEMVNKFATESAVKMIAAWLREKRRNDYEVLFKDGIFQQLLSIQEANISTNINIEFQLETETYISDSVTVTYPVFWDRTKNILLFNNDIRNSQLSKVLAKGLLTNYKDLADWIELVLQASDTERLKDKNWNVPQEIIELCRKDSSELPIDPIDTNSKVSKNDSNINLLSEHISSTASIDNDKSQQISIDSNDIKNVSTTEQNHQITTKSQDNAKNNTPKSQHPNPDVKHQDIIDIVENTGHLAHDFAKEIKESFNKSGITSFNDEYMARVEDTGFGEIINPGQRGARLRDDYFENIRNEPAQDVRWKQTERCLLESPNEAVRKTLYEWYLGRCQICDETWPKRNGEPFFTAAYLVERHHARWIDEPGNAICLCAKHFAQWRHATKKEFSDVTEQIINLRLRAEGGDGNLSIKFNLLNVDCGIKYNEKHIIALKKLIEVANDCAINKDADLIINCATDVCSNNKSSSDNIIPVQNETIAFHDDTLLKISSDFAGKVNSGKYIDKSGHEIIIYRHTLNSKDNASRGNLQSTKKVCPYCKITVNENQYEKHITNKCPKRPNTDTQATSKLSSMQTAILASLSNAQSTSIYSNPSQNRCKFCDSRPMLGSDVCYSCSS